MFKFTFDKRDYPEKVKEFNKIMSMFLIKQQLYYNNIDIIVTYIEMLSVINGKYFFVLNEFNKIFYGRKVYELVTNDTKTIQKLINKMKFCIKTYELYQTDIRVHEVVYYAYIKKY